ncbi:complement component receptor 1-like protein [Melanerpes formicivorus]|uniref:complement component receptor 1-like protein n=1 Tax=Melanerpes formicivorus TaxID=211600 RepID=UPI00359005B5
MLGSLLWPGQLLAVVVVVVQPGRSLEFLCPIPHVLHGQLRPAQNSPYSNSATLECDEGYVPVGGYTTLWCLSSGRWQPRAPACTLGRCHRPPAVSNADYPHQNEFPVGTAVTYFCRLGYSLLPDVSPTTTCLTNFTWSPVPQLCQEVQCPSPALPHGRLLSPGRGNYSYRQQVEFQCDRGHLLRGSRRSQCWHDGFWRPAVPYCDQVCGPPPQISKGQHSSPEELTFPYGSEVKYRCTEGLALVGSESIYCTSEDGVNLAWSGPAPECKVVRCPKPAVERGRMAPQRFTFPYKATVRFSCDEGFVLHGAAESQCLSDSSWHPPLPTCQPVLCPEPQVANGKVESPLEDQSWYPMNATVTLECLPGYHFSADGGKASGDSWTATCLPDGSWTPMPQCKRKEAAAVCEEVHAIKSLFDCGLPAAEVKTLLEVQKLYLEVKKLKEELENLTKQRSTETAAMKPGEPGQEKQPGALSCRASARLWGSGHSTLLLALMGLLGMPVACAGDCGPPPQMTYSRPSSKEDVSSFPVGSKVTYTCLEGAIKVPGRSDTVQCLPGARWSQLPEPCGRSCGAPTRLRFAALSKVDERINFFPVGANVSYVCRPGYENTSESVPTSTCLHNLTWSQAAELCRRKSCGEPGAVPGGRMDLLTDLQLGATVKVLCQEGYRLEGNHFILCQLKGDDVEWSELPTCELITCSSPPQITNGNHDGEGAGKFVYNSTVTYSCAPGFQLVGNSSIRCTSGAKARGVWSGAAPECRGGVVSAWEKSTSARAGGKEVQRSLLQSPHLHTSRGNSIQASKKASKWERKLSLYKKSLQNTISLSRSASFSRPPVSRSCATSAFRFVVPLYKTQTYSSPGTSQGSLCLPKYLGISGILPQASCFANMKQSKLAAFCGTRSWAARRSWTWQKCCYSRFPIHCRGFFYT